MAKLTIAQWALCRDDFENKGMSLSELSSKYGVNKSNISRKAKSEGWAVSTIKHTDKPTQHKRNANATGGESQGSHTPQAFVGGDATGGQGGGDATGETQQVNATEENPENLENAFFSSGEIQSSLSSHMGEDFDVDFMDFEYDPVSDTKVKSALNSIDSELAILANAYGGHSGYVKYHPAFARVAYQSALLGLTQKELGGLLGVSEVTIGNWLRSKKEFAVAWKGGARFADMRVAQSLFKSANGFFETISETKVIQGQEVDVEKTIFIEPSFNAQRFWLTNRQPELWRDKIEIKQEITAAVIDKEAMKLRYDKVLEDASVLKQEFMGRAERLSLRLDGDSDE